MYIERNNNRSYGPVESDKIRKSYNQILNLLETIKHKYNVVKESVDDLEYDTNFNEEINDLKIDKYFKNNI